MRQPYLGLVFGKKGVGKTHTTLELIFKYLMGTLGAGAPGRKVLILDINDEYKMIPALAPEDIPTFSGQYKIEARRIRPYKPNGMAFTVKDTMEALEKILKYFRGGLLLLEDPSKYISANLTTDVYGAIIALRHHDTDCIMHFQRAGAPGPGLWGNINWIRFHQVTESVNKVSQTGKFEEYIEPFNIIELMIDEQVRKGNKYIHLYYEEHDGKIRGAYSQKMLYDAIKQYIGINFKSIVQPKIKMYDMTLGDYRVSHPKDIIDREASRMFYEYYGGSMQIMKSAA